MCMNALHTCVSLYHVSAWYPMGPEGSPRTRLTESCEPPCGCSESSLGLLEEQPVLLTMKPPLQSQCTRF